MEKQTEERGPIETLGGARKFPAEARETSLPSLTFSDLGRPCSARIHHTHQQPPKL